MISARFLRVFSASRRQAFEAVLVRYDMSGGPPPQSRCPGKPQGADSGTRKTGTPSALRLPRSVSLRVRGHAAIFNNATFSLIFVSSSKPSQAAKDSGVGAQSRHPPAHGAFVQRGRFLSQGSSIAAKDRLTPTRLSFYSMPFCAESTGPIIFPSQPDSSSIAAWSSGSTATGGGSRPARSISSRPIHGLDDLPLPEPRPPDGFRLAPAIADDDGANVPIDQLALLG